MDSQASHHSAHSLGWVAQGLLQSPQVKIVPKSNFLCNQIAKRNNVNNFVSAFPGYSHGLSSFSSFSTQAWLGCSGAPPIPSFSGSSTPSSVATSATPSHLTDSRCLELIGKLYEILDHSGNFNWLNR